MVEDNVYVYRIEQELEETTVKLDIDESKLNESLMVVKQYIAEGWPNAKKIEGAAMIYNRYRDELRFKEGEIWRFD
jgi:predicted lipase